MDTVSTATDHQPPTDHDRTRRRWSRRSIGLASVVLVGVAGAGAWATLPKTSPDADPVEDRLQSLVEAGYPSALASVTGPDGQSTDATAGADVPADGEIRIASNTKMFVATVVMQLVDEGAVDLDASVETYLPGLVVGTGIDGAGITVRQLLQHTSGLPEYADQIAADAFAVREQYVSPRDMLDVALERPAAFAPGERWEYSNTNYLVLGLLVERVTDRALGEQIDERVVEPLGLEHTYLPHPGERELRGPHPTGFHAKVAGELVDFTALDPSFAWAAGAMVSTPSELNTFMQALLDGELVSEQSLAAMQTGVPAGDELWPEATYGLGLQSYPLSCGGTAWGHGGDIPGMQTRNAVGPDGTSVTIAVPALPWAVTDPADEEKLLDQYKIVVEVLDETLCDQ